jgi:hypothetical protein
MSADEFPPLHHERASVSIAGALASVGEASASVGEASASIGEEVQGGRIKSARIESASVCVPGNQLL